MSLGRPVAKIELNPAEEGKLRTIAARRKSQQQESLRARIILLCAEGLPNQEIAQRERVTPATVGKWRKRFAEERLEALVDLPRSGAPRKISDEKVDEIITKTLEEKPAAR